MRQVRPPGIVGSARAALRPRHPPRDRCRPGPARAVRRRHGPAQQRRPAPRPLLPGLPEPPVQPHRSGGGAGRADRPGRAEGDEPFVLHPGEFVLGSTLEDGHPARRPRRAAGGQVQPRAGSACSPTRPPASSTPASPVTSRSSCPTWPTCRSSCGPGMKVGQLCLFRLESARRASVRLGRSTARGIRVSAARPRPVRGGISAAPRSDQEVTVRVFVGDGEVSGLSVRTIVSVYVSAGSVTLNGTLGPAILQPSDRVSARCPCRHRSSAAR